MFDYYVRRRRQAAWNGDFDQVRNLMEEALQAAPDQEAQAFALRRLTRLRKGIG